MSEIEKQFILVIVATLIFSTLAVADSLLIGMSEEFKPYNYKENDKWMGIDVEIANEVFRRLDVNIKYGAFPWARVMEDAKHGKIDGILSVYCNDTRSFLENTHEPSYSVNISVFCLKEKKMKISGLKDLGGRIVGVVRGNYYGKALEKYKDIVKLEYVSTPKLANLLFHNRIDFAFHESGPFLFYSNQLGFKDQFEDIYTWKKDMVCMAFSKKALGLKSKMWAEKVSKMIFQMKREGFVDKIISKYIGE